MRQRPEHFTLDYSLPLARGLVFAGLGGSPGSVCYKDSSGHRNDGILTSMTPSTDWVWIPELRRCGLEFAGGSQRVILPNVSLFVFNTFDFSISIWYSLFDGGDSYSAAIGCGATGENEWMLRVRDFVWFYGDGGAINTNIAGLTKYEWNCVTIVRKNEILFMYVNSIIVNQDNTALHDIASTKAITIGGCGTDRNMAGQIADVMIYRRAISSNEIQELANPSNIMLSNMIKPPKRKLYAIRNTAYSRHYFVLNSGLGTPSVLRLTS